MWILLILLLTPSSSHANADFLPQQVDVLQLSLLESWARRNGNLQVIFSSHWGEDFDPRILESMLRHGDSIRVVFEMPPEEVRRINVEQITRKLVGAENGVRRLQREAQGWKDGLIWEEDQIYSLVTPSPARAESLLKKAEEYRRDAATLVQALEHYKSPDFTPEVGYFAWIIEGDQIIERWRSAFKGLIRGPEYKVLTVARIPNHHVKRFNLLHVFDEWTRTKCEDALARWTKAEPKT